MAEVEYRDLRDAGLRFVTPREEQFAALVEEIRSRAMGPPVPEGAALEAAAVLLNESGKAVLGMTLVWTFTDAGSTPQREFSSNIGQQTLDLLTGRLPLVLDRFSCIAPGSKRLITPDGTFGDNSDVIPPDPRRSGGVIFGRGGGGGRRRREWKSAELTLDVAWFEDGLCAGPDASGTFDRVRADIELQQSIAAELVVMIRAGATPGQVFERLLPDARQRFATAPEPRAHYIGGRQTFAQSVILRYTHQSDAELLAWLEGVAGPPAIELRRAQ